jgi:hypothetical protein
VPTTFYSMSSYVAKSNDHLVIFIALTLCSRFEYEFSFMTIKTLVNTKANGTVS